MSLYHYINIDEPSSDGRGCYLNSSNVAHRLDDDLESMLLKWSSPPNVIP